MWIAGVAAACVVAWAVRPFAVMVRRGTLDEQRLAAIREETARLEGAADGRPSATGADDDVAVPQPRPSAESPASSDVVGTPPR